MNTNYHQLTSEEVCSDLESDPIKGLSSQQAQQRIHEQGLNEFKKVKRTSLFLKFISQFKSFMIIVLLVAALVSGIIGYLHGEGFTDAIIILTIVFLNAIIGMLQEAKAEKSLDALERMSAPKCKVIRDGKTQIIESKYLVRGDIVIFETGDNIPADLRIIDESNLKIEEAALTGESLPVEKDCNPIQGDVPLGDRLNMAYSSCHVTYGHGKGIVTATGQNTEIGKIASMIQSVPETKTPMQHRLDQLGKTLAIAALAICALIFIVGILYGNDLLTMFMTAVSLAAAAIPEGLPAVSTIVLAIGVQRLAKRNAIVRNLPSVETLGSTTVICSDKTGTLTQNKMTIVESDSDNEELSIRIGILSNDTKISREGETVRTIGDPTETSIVDFGLKKGLDKEILEREYPRVAEIPFDSERKLMTTIHKVGNRYFIATKGGVDEILQRCDRYFGNGEVYPLISDVAIEIENKNMDMASKALRVLATAYKEVDTLPEVISSETIENQLIFCGLFGMIDPPREEVKLAVEQAVQAGIRPVMITGDHKITAEAIAESLKIKRDGDIALTGAEVANMSDEELLKVANHTSVFARVAPEHKVRIVQTFQNKGNVVAMTGDGVNDAPALKLADIGVAMGITGTDVSKEAADVVLADDNFATIVTAVSEGRKIYDNLLKAIQFLLSTNIGEVLVLFVAVLANLVTPLLPIHILWINLVTDSLPALALSFDPAERDVMKRKPIAPNQGIFTKEFTFRVLLQGILIAIVSLTAYYIGMKTSVECARTMTFATLAFSQMTIIFSIRSGKDFGLRNLFSNKYLLGAMLLVAGLMLMVLLIPSVASLFQVVSLNMTQWIWIISLSAGIFIVCEIIKLIRRAFGK